MPHKDSNLVKLIQSQLCYHYTMRQRKEMKNRLILPNPAAFRNFFLSDGKGPCRLAAMAALVMAVIFLVL